MPKARSLLLSCEHGGAQIPPAYRSLLLPRERQDLSTHRGWDRGALIVARALQKEFACPLYASEVSRLLIDLNRSAHHRSCLGLSYRSLSKAEKEAIYEGYYWPYRLGLEKGLKKLLADRKRPVLHLSIHSFTPVLNGLERQAEIGLLYDPARSSEKEWAARLHAAIAQVQDGWRIRRNYPYQGKADGLTRHLRQVFGPRRYAGFEIEVNQALLASPAQARKVAHTMILALEQLRSTGHL